MEKPKRPKKINSQEIKIPSNIRELIAMYDLENLDIYDYLDKLVEYINKENEKGISETLITLNTGTSATVTVPDLSQYRYILLQACYYNDTNRVLASSIGTYQQFKNTLANHPWEAVFKDGSTIDVSAKYNSDTSVTLTRKGSSDAVTLIGIK